MNLVHILRRFCLAAIVTLGPTAVSAANVSAQVVAFDDANSEAGTIVVRTGERRLYLVLGGGKAIRYDVGVGRSGRQWSGATQIDGKFVKPNWAPPAAILLDRPTLPRFIAGGDPNNPMGAAALTLAGGDYAIHGTNDPDSIGGFVSYGCIRMHNADIADLFSRVSLGTPVLVVR